MICPECKSKGKIGSELVCTTCGGFGIIHCCEGHQAQLDKLAETPHQSTTVDPPIDHLFPTS